MTVTRFIAAPTALKREFMCLQAIYNSLKGILGANSKLSQVVLVVSGLLGCKEGYIRRISSCRILRHTRVIRDIRVITGIRYCLK